MNKGYLKKNMLLKKKKEDGALANGDSVSAKNHADCDVLRILAVEEDRVLVIDCVKKTMPVWIDISGLTGFTDEKDIHEDCCQSADIDILESYAPKIKKII